MPFQIDRVEQKTVLCERLPAILKKNASPASGGTSNLEFQTDQVEQQQTAVRGLSNFKPIRSVIKQRYEAFRISNRSKARRSF
mmetsp:Transcript_28888/g.62216  ORF Transcript_28888/g.62216 Transcript_28888/m.62216 type:complete len:83 (-) Transcript_28888:755-1003(-)